MQCSIKLSYDDMICTGKPPNYLVAFARLVRLVTEQVSLEGGVTDGSRIDRTSWLDP